MEEKPSKLFLLTALAIAGYGSFKLSTHSYSSNRPEPEPIVSGTVIGETHRVPGGLLSSSTPYTFSLRTEKGPRTFIVEDDGITADTLIEPNFYVSVRVDDSWMQYCYKKEGPHNIEFEKHVVSISDESGNKIK